MEIDKEILYSVTVEDNIYAIEPPKFDSYEEWSDWLDDLDSWWWLYKSNSQTYRSLQMKYQIEYTMEVNGYPGSAVHYWWCDGLADLKMTLETFEKSTAVKISDVVINTIED